MAKLEENHKGKSILLVTHGMFIRCLFEVLDDNYSQADWLKYVEEFESGRKVFEMQEARLS